MTDEAKALAARQYAEGATLTAVGRRHGVSRETIRLALIELGVERRPKGRPAQEDREPRPCGVEDCGRPLFAGGLCNTHYMRLRRRGAVRPADPIRPWRRQAPR